MFVAGGKEESPEKKLCKRKAKKRQKTQGGKWALIICSRVLLIEVRSHIALKEITSEVSMWVGVRGARWRGLTTRPERKAYIFFGVYTHFREVGRGERVLFEANKKKRVEGKG